MELTVSQSVIAEESIEHLMRRMQHSLGTPKCSTFQSCANAHFGTEKGIAFLSDHFRTWSVVVVVVCVTVVDIEKTERWITLKRGEEKEKKSN